MKLSEDSVPEMENSKEEQPAKRSDDVTEQKPEQTTENGPITADHEQEPEQESDQKADQSPVRDPNKPKSIGTLVKESDNEEAKRLKQEIDSLRKKRDRLISEMRSARRTITYKREEYTAFSKFLEVETNKPDQRAIARLKREKNRLEFKLSTEPRLTLDTERELIRRIDEVGAELNTKLRYAGLEKKATLLKEDIDKYSTRIDSISKELNDMNEKFDKMYAELKSMLGIKSIPKERKAAPSSRPPRPEKKKYNAPEEINLEDIAVIKRKTTNNENGNEK